VTTPARDKKQSQKEVESEWGESWMAEAEFYPEWMTYELENVLRQITGRHARKKRTTILRLAEGVVVGRTVTETLAMAETCSDTTWYGRYARGEKKPGWKDDPLIARALKMATQRAHYASDSYILEQITETRKLLAQYGPGAVHKLGGLMLTAGSESLQRLSALDILDRLDPETASKGTSPPASGEPLVVVHLPDNERGDRDKAPTETGEVPGDTG
jgi:hypothetical protein